MSVKEVLTQIQRSSEGFPLNESETEFNDPETDGVIADAVQALEEVCEDKVSCDVTHDTDTGFWGLALKIDGWVNTIELTPEHGGYTVATDGEDMVPSAFDQEPSGDIEYEVSKQDVLKGLARLINMIRDYEPPATSKIKRRNIAMAAIQNIFAKLRESTGTTGFEVPEVIGKVDQKQNMDESEADAEQLSIIQCHDCHAIVSSLDEAEDGCPVCGSDNLDEKLVKVIRDGKLVKKNKRTHKVRLTPAQKAALRKALKKAHTASANRNRKKSMKIHKRKLG